MEDAAEIRLGISSREQEAAEAVSRFGEAAIPGLLRLLKHDDEEVRILAAYTVRNIDGLGEVHPDDLIDAQLEDDSWLPPAIARIGTERALEFLRSELAKYPNPNTQHTFAWKRLGEKGLPYLLDAYECETDSSTVSEQTHGTSRDGTSRDGGGPLGRKNVRSQRGK